MSFLTVAPYSDIGQIISDVIKAGLLWLAMIAMITSAQNVRRLVSAIMVVVCLNGLVSGLERQFPFANVVIHQVTLSAGANVERLTAISRATGFYNNPNVAAQSFLFAILLAPWAPRWLGWLGGISAAGGILLSESRQGAYLMILCGLAYLAYQASSYAKRSKSAGAAAIILSGALIVGLFASSYDVMASGDQPIEGSRNRLFQAEEGARNRGSVGAVGLAKAEDSPWYGYGAYSFRDSDLVKYGNRRGEHGSHNIYLTIWGEAGLPMLVAYLTMMTFSFRRMSKLRVVDRRTRTLNALMWWCFIAIGVTWHGQFGEVTGLMFAGLSFLIPRYACNMTINMEKLESPLA